MTVLPPEMQKMSQEVDGAVFVTSREDTAHAA